MRHVETSVHFDPQGKAARLLQADGSSCSWCRQGARHQRERSRTDPIPALPCKQWREKRPGATRQASDDRRVRSHTQVRRKSRRQQASALCLGSSVSGLRRKRGGLSLLRASCPSPFGPASPFAPLLRRSGPRLSGQTGKRGPAAAGRRKLLLQSSKIRVSM